MPSTESLYVISLVFFSFYLFIRTCLHCSRVSIQCEIVCCACPLPGASRKSHESCDSLIRNWNYLSTIARINIIWNYRLSNFKLQIHSKYLSIYHRQYVKWEIVLRAWRTLLADGACGKSTAFRDFCTHRRYRKFELVECVFRIDSEWNKLFACPKNVNFEIYKCVHHHLWSLALVRSLAQCSIQYARTHNVADQHASV